MSGKHWILGLGGATLLYYTILRPRMLVWGLSPIQAREAYMGDEIILHPMFTMTHAIEMNTSTESVWRWLAQMGRDDVGFYAFDAMLNRGIRSATSLRPNLPALSPGTKLDNGYQILQFQTEKYLVLGGFQCKFGSAGLHDVTHSYHLEALSPNRTRLIWRVRLYAYGLMGLGMSQLVEPWYFVFGQIHLQHLATLSTQITVNREKVNGHHAKILSIS